MDKDQLAKTIGENIIYYRKAAQMNQGKLAEQLQLFYARWSVGGKIPGCFDVALSSADFTCFDRCVII